MPGLAVALGKSSALAISRTSRGHQSLDALEDDGGSIRCGRVDDANRVVVPIGHVKNTSCVIDIGGGCEQRRRAIPPALAANERLYLTGRRVEPLDLGVEGVGDPHCTITVGDPERLPETGLGSRAIRISKIEESLGADRRDNRRTLQA